MTDNRPDPIPELVGSLRRKRAEAQEVAAGSASSGPPPRLRHQNEAATSQRWAECSEIVELAERFHVWTVRNRIRPGRIRGWTRGWQLLGASVTLVTHPPDPDSRRIGEGTTIDFAWASLYVLASGELATLRTVSDSPGKFEFVAIDEHTIHLMMGISYANRYKADHNWSLTSRHLPYFTQAMRERIAEIVLDSGIKWP